MPFFDRDGVKFNFEEYGEGTPLIFSHGLGSNLSVIRDLIGPMPGVRVILYDNRGHGRTTGFMDPARLNFNSLADDMAAMLDHCGVDRAITGGVSMGSGISIAFCRRYPHRAHALILSRPAWLDQPFPPNLAVIGEIARLIDEMGVAPALRHVESLEAFASLRRKFPETASGLLQNLENARDARVGLTYRAILASVPFEKFDDLGSIRAPTLVLANHDDPIHPFDLAERLAAGIPGAIFREFPSKYRSWEEHQQGFRSCLTEFLKTL